MKGASKQPYTFCGAGRFAAAPPAGTYYPFTPACGHYDADESCSATAVDQACGKHFGVFGPNVDTDQNCIAQGGTNATDNTGKPNTTL